MIRILLLLIICIVSQLLHAQNLTAIDSLRQTIESAKNDTNKIRAFNELAHKLRQMGNYSEARRYADSALILSKSIDLGKVRGWYKGEEIAYENIALIYRYQGNYPSAFKYDSMALKISIEHDYKAGLSATYSAIGNIFDEKGDYAQALKNFFLALKVDEETGNKQNIANGYGSIGNIYTQQGDFSEALTNYFAALKILEEVKDKEGEANTYMNIGIIYAMQGDKKEALNNLFKALKLYQELGYKPSVAMSYGNIAVIYAQQGNYTEALKYQFQTLRTYEEIGNKDGIAFSYINIGEMYNDQQKFVQAEPYIIKGLEMSKEIKSKEYIKAAYNDLSASYYGQKKFKKAFDTFQNYVQAKDSLFNEASTKQIAQMKAQYETQKKSDSIRAVSDSLKISKGNETIAQQQSNQRKIYLTVAIVIGIISILFLSILFRSITKRRAAESEKQRVEFESKLRIAEAKALRAQMDDHFIKGVNNSILYLMEQGKTDEAKAYQEDFGALVDKVLMSSDSEEKGEDVTLSAEIEILELYLRLEGLRFGSKFYDLKIDESIDRSAIIFPSLILQPFAENSVVHGLADLTAREPKLTIEIMKENGSLKCRVTDNGIGREQSAKFKSTSVTTSKRSFSLKATRERIELFNALKHVVSSFVIRDLPEGTEVEYIIPLLTKF